MKNKNFTRFLCFFVCFCLCFAWFGPATEAKAAGGVVALLGVLIAFCLGNGIGFAVSGSADCLISGLEELVNDFIINYDGPQDFWEVIARDAVVDASGYLLLGKLAVDYLNNFIDWLLNVRMVFNESDQFVFEGDSYWTVPALLNGESITFESSSIRYVDGSYVVDQLRTVIPYSTDCNGYSYAIHRNGVSSAATQFQFDIDGEYIYFYAGSTQAGSYLFLSRKSSQAYESSYLGYVIPDGYSASDIIGITLGDCIADNGVDVGGVFIVFSDGTVRRVFPYSSFDNLNDLISVQSVYSSAGEITRTDDFSLPDTSDWDDTTAVGFIHGTSGKIPSSIDEYNSQIIESLNDGVVPEISTEVITDVLNPDIDVPDTNDGTLFGYLSGILQAIKALPGSIANLILDGIKSIFIPDPDVIEAAYMDLLDEINSKYSFGFDLDSLVRESVEPEDITAVYSVGPLSWDVTFVSWYYMKKGVQFFRPFIRGFIVLMLLFYNLRQFMAIFGLGGVMNGDSADRRVNDLAV